ncbi:uncharacterized protein LOC107369158 [Tetranychus urticae]|uniref:Uncharacterized protein n=1 Tax=Tetranychus urticae TaxID=32264 RepID=T1L0I2_TETUR|nr:uncharacterized protein LOC107369158 [Tetranychus urticae]
MSISFSQLTRTHMIAIGVTVLLATAICVGVLVSKKSSSSQSSTSLFATYKDKLLQLDHATQWKSYTSETVSLDGAFEAGEDSDGKKIYPCRASYSRDLMSGTFKSNACWVTYGGRAYSQSTFELLVTKNPSALLWLPNSNGGAYNGAIVSGMTYTDDELLAARVSFYYYYAVGKMHDRYASAYVPRGNTEYETKEYEALCAVDYSL